MKSLEEILFEDYRIKVVRKNIKNVYMRVLKNGEIVVSSPRLLPSKALRDFVFSKGEWLKKAVESMEDRQAERCDLVDGGRIYILGKEYYLRVVSGKMGAFFVDGNTVNVCVKGEASEENIKAVVASAYRQMLEEILPEMIERCQTRSGITASEWRLKNMKTRWGSCNTQKKRIWLSVWLASKKYEYIEAVMLHELTHIKEKGHGKGFYALLESYCPDYRKTVKDN